MSRSSGARDRRRWLACWLSGVGLVVACGDDLPTGAGAHVGSETASGSTSGSTTFSVSPSSTGSSSPTTGAVDGTTNASEDGVLFLQEPDGPTAIECDFFEQDCPRGSKCVAYSTDGSATWNGTHCVPIVSRPHGKGEPCTVVDHPWSGQDDCDAGLVCWEVDPRTLEGTCVALCIGPEANPTCSDPCETCPVTADGWILICRSTCDALLQSCPRGQGCYLVYDDFRCISDASPEGVGVGSPCEFIEVCPPGTVCLSAESVPGCPAGSEGCCTPFCPVGESDLCPWLLPGSSCMPLFDEGRGPPEGCTSAPVGACVQQ